MEIALIGVVGRCVMSDHNFVFVDVCCPHCNGVGFIYFKREKMRCSICHGQGRLGGYEYREVCEPKPDDLAMQLRSVREWRKISMKELASSFGMSVTRLSEIERGVGDPRTPDEDRMVRAWIEGSY